MATPNQLARELIEQQLEPVKPLALLAQGDITGALKEKYLPQQDDMEPPTVSSTLRKYMDARKKSLAMMQNPEERLFYHVLPRPHKELDQEHRPKQQPAQPRFTDEELRHNALLQALENGTIKQAGIFQDIRRFFKKKKSQGSVHMQNVRSSNLKSIGYHPAAHQLYVEFKNSGKYKYQNVSKSMFNSLLHASSKGKHFNRYVKNKKPFEKISSLHIDPKKIEQFTQRLTRMAKKTPPPVLYDPPPVSQQDVTNSIKKLNDTYNRLKPTMPQSRPNLPPPYLPPEKLIDPSKFDKLLEMNRRTDPGGY